MKNKSIPYGMLYEEKPELKSQGFINPFYNRDESISMIQDSSGKLIPFIHSFSSLMATQTKLMTRTVLDETDTDPGDD